jgi:hypothetical protein
MLPCLLSFIVSIVKHFLFVVPLLAAGLHFVAPLLITIVAPLLVAVIVALLLSLELLMVSLQIVGIVVHIKVSQSPYLWFRQHL